MRVSLSPRSAVPLTDQIVDGLKRQIDGRGLRPGSRLPSIRRFAAAHDVSRFTVVQAYDRLVAAGYLESRRGSGFFVNVPASEPRAASDRVLSKAFDDMWLLRLSTGDNRAAFVPGCGWLPGDWQDAAGLERGLREVARLGARHFVEGYSAAMGYLPLRQDIQRQLAATGINAELGQIMTTGGIVGALDLIGRYLLKRGDTVLVDDPGTLHIFGQLRTLGVTLMGVPWTPEGPDTDALAALIETHRPRAYFTNSVVHNPTGASISHARAHQVLRLAEQNELYVIEDDVYRDLQPEPAARLASLDQLERVIYVSGFSKTLSAQLRVGYLAAHEDLVRDLVDFKRMTSMATPDVTERLVHQVLREGHYRKHLARLHVRLGKAMDKALREHERCGLKPYIEPSRGMFLWSRFDHVDDSSALADAAAEQRIMLAPGMIFRPSLRPSPWMRFNVAFCDHLEIYDFLKQAAESEPEFGLS